MPWKIEFTDKARKRFDKLDHTTQLRILKFLKELVSLLYDHLLAGKMLTGNLSGHVRYRVGDYRLIARMERDRLVVLVVGVGHRRLVYSE